MSTLLYDYIVDPVRAMVTLRLRYFAAARSRWLALALLVAILITMLAIPEMNLTGTRWAVFLPFFGSYIMARLSSGVALFDYGSRAQGGNLVDVGWDSTDDVKLTDDVGLEFK